MSSASLIFSLPGTETFQSFRQEPSGEERFVVRPFEGRQAELRGVVEAADPLQWTPAFPSLTHAPVKGREEYTAMVQRAQRWCAERSGKVVLSRVWEERAPHFHAGQVLFRLRELHPNAFVYGLSHEDFGCWIGATPERLLTHHSGTYKTVALAGTKLDEEEWTEKERREQQVVTDYLLASIQGEEVTTRGPENARFGALRHLQTEITWKAEALPLAVAEQLHPTPAVCGFPVAGAQAFIRAEEGYDRQLYTGYLGWVNGREDAHLFVNLRCMQLFRDRVRFYAGGGINAWSDPGAEWRETERKIESIRQTLWLP